MVASHARNEGRGKSCFSLKRKGEVPPNARDGKGKVVPHARMERQRLAVLEGRGRGCTSMKGEGEVGPHARKDMQGLALIEGRGKSLPNLKGEAEVAPP